jgi:hypothetical protein
LPDYQKGIKNIKNFAISLPAANYDLAILGSIYTLSDDYSDRI